jgi:hypothetical protein
VYSYAKHPSTLFIKFEIGDDVVKIAGDSLCHHYRCTVTYLLMVQIFRQALRLNAATDSTRNRKDIE